MSTIDPNTKPIDRESIWGTYLSSVGRRQKIADKAIHKALDLPDDDDVRITNVKTSGGSALAAGALALLGVATGAGVVHFLDNAKQDNPASVGQDTNTRYGYEFRLGEPNNNTPE